MLNCSKMSVILTLFQLTVSLLLLLAGHAHGQGQTCSTGFPMYQAVTSLPCQSPCSIGGLNTRKLYIFTSMKITCNGSVQGLTVAGEVGAKSNQSYPELQVWRPITNGGSTFTKTTPVFEFPVSCSQIATNVQNCSLNHLPVREGDIIGIIIPRNHMNFAAFRIYFSGSSTDYYIPSTDQPMFTLSPADDSFKTAQSGPMIYLDILPDQVPTVQPPVTDPPVTEPPVTDPPVTAQPTVTDPPETEPPVTDPPVTAQPPVTDPPVTAQPPVTDPPVTAQPPVTDPPVTDQSSESSISLPVAPGVDVSTGSVTNGLSTTDAEATSGVNMNGSGSLSNSAGNVDSNSSVSSAGAAVGGVIAILLLILIIVIIGIYVGWSRRRASYRTKKAAQLAQNNDLINPVYGVEQVIAFQSRVASHGLPVVENPNYDYSAIEMVQETTIDYDEIDDIRSDTKTKSTVNTGVYEVPGHCPTLIPHTPSAYEVPADSLSKAKQSLPDGSHYKWGLVVPSQELRMKTLSMKPQTSQGGEDIYASLVLSQYQEGQSAPKFFEEAETYWAPSSDPCELYQQLATKKYREIPRPQIQVTDFLGAGAFGTVSKGLWQSPAGVIPVAIKTVQSKVEADKVKFLQEAAIMGQFRHPNVVKLIGVVTVGEPVMIVLELLSNGDLHGFLKRQRPVPGEMVPSSTPKLLLKFCQNIACGMEYLARKAFVHRDLAARNILLSEDVTCKISDFGMSRELMDGDYYVSQGGKVPVRWTAPEAIHYKKYSTASDVWSFGCVMYEIWSMGHKPFEGYSNSETIKMVGNGTRLPPPPGCPRELYRFMIECWHPDSSRRPSFAQLVEMLSQADFELLFWQDADFTSDSMALKVGAPLNAGEKMFRNLQQTYVSAPATQ